MEILTPSELKEKYDDTWITPYHEIITITDDDEQVVELIEYHPCPVGSDWMITQYKRTSPLIIDAKRDGNKHTYTLKTGSVEMDLKPSFKAAGIQQVEVDEDEIKVVHAGLAGAGVGAAFCRGKADGVKRVEIHEKGGGSKVGRAAVVTPKYKKVIIGLDDTDIPTEGATWTLANNIANEIQDEKGYKYLEHITCQLFPENPNKTKNCVSIILTFAIKSEDEEDLIKCIAEKLEKYTLSDNTAFVVYDKFEIPEDIKKYAIEAKKSMKTLAEAQKLAMDNNIRVEYVTGKPGLIGALAALGLYGMDDEYAKVYKKGE